jgi:hypothetical protein
MLKREGWAGPESTPNGRVRQGRLALFDWNQLPGAALGWDIALKILPTQQLRVRRAYIQSSAQASEASVSGLLHPTVAGPS